MTDKELKNELTRILCEKNLNAKNINKLKELGFELEDGSKHYKMYYHSRKDKLITVSKSLSDSGRGGKNLVSTIMRIVKEINQEEIQKLSLI